MWRFCVFFLGMIVAAALVAPAMARVFIPRLGLATEVGTAQSRASAGPVASDGRPRLTTSDHLDPFTDPQPVTIRHVRVVPATGRESLTAESAALGSPRSRSASSFDMLIAAPIIERALARYPSEAFRERNIELIVVGGIPSSGSDSGEWLGWFRATASGFELGVSTRHAGGDVLPDREIERTIHHELSSWVLEQIDRDALLAVWEHFLPHGFAYYGHAGGLVPCDEAGWARQHRDDLLAVGFAQPYGLTNFENDFNTLAEYAFCPDDEFAEAVETSPFLQWKLRVMSRAYERAGLPFPLAFDAASSTFSLSRG